MRRLGAISFVLCLFAGFACAARAASQATGEAERSPAPSVATVEVTAARPVARALDVIEQRYGVVIDYSDPDYASTVDTQLMYTFHGKPTDVPLLVSRIRTLRLQYAVASDGGPAGGMTALLERLVAQYAADGGQVFEVQELSTHNGPRWEVYPVKVHDDSGTLVYQKDYLGAILHIPTAKRTPAEMLDLIVQQLTQIWGRRFWVALNYNIAVGPPPELGAESITARQAIVALMGRGVSLRMFTAPGEDNSYAISLMGLPYREPPRPPAPPAAVPAPFHPGPVPPIVWMHRATTAGGIMQIRDALSKAGYLSAGPSGKWDQSAAGAMRRFQAANGLPPTGALDAPTILRLEPFLPKLVAHPPAPTAMYPDLYFWLESTQSGWTEIQMALAKAGFYSDETTGQFDLKTREALKAFQAANGLPPQDFFDAKTAEKLAPLLPKQD